MKIILTGFEPFGGESTNPAWDSVQMVADNVAGITVIKAELPCVFGESGEVLDKLIERENPDFVLCVGQAGGRATLAVERVGINLMDARIGDNKGNSPVDEPVFADGKEAYFSNLPVKAMVAAIRESGVPSSVSYTAGTYVCNYILYHTLHRIATKHPNIKGGFIHVPFSTEQGVNKPPNVATMELATIAKGLTAAIACLATATEDITVSEGTTH